MHAAILEPQNDKEDVVAVVFTEGDEVVEDEAVEEEEDAAVDMANATRAATRVETITSHKML